jgi:hypothetical protein
MPAFEATSAARVRAKPFSEITIAAADKIARRSLSPFDVLVRASFDDMEAIEQPYDQSRQGWTVVSKFNAP